MMTEADYYALFEAYAPASWPRPPAPICEARLAADPALALRYADFAELTGTLRAYGQRQAGTAAAARHSRRHAGRRAAGRSYADHSHGSSACSRTP